MQTPTSPRHTRRDFIPAHACQVSIDGLMPVTEDPRYFPSLRSMVPNDQEFGFPEAFLGLDIAEHVKPLFDGSIPFDGINLHASRRKYTPKMTAHILARLFDVVVSRPGDATLVVIELDARIQITRMLFQLVGRAAMIEGIKEFAIQF